MGLKVKLTDTVFTDLTLPKLYPDAVMSAGSLYLIDLSHPNGYDNGVLAPTAGTLIPNVAYETAAALIGSGDRTSLSPTLTISIPSPSNYKVEFSAKKGLHALISQVNIAAAQSVKLTIPAAIQAYLYNNPNRQYFVSYWSRVTRAALTQVTADLGFFQASSGVNNVFSFVDKEIHPLTSPQRLGFHSVPAIANAPIPAGNSYRNVGFTGVEGTLPVIGSMFGAWKAGAEPSTYSSAEAGKAKSVILYRIYIEDLTASGRTYAQADALDYAQYQAAFGVGGRFAGDSFTDPATLL